MNSFYFDHIKLYNEILSSSKFLFKGEEIDPDCWYNAVAEILINGADNGGKAYFMGNGASAGMASHFANDFTKNGWVPSHTLTDPAFLTCFANDYSYRDSFAEMLKRYLGKLDSLVLISSSGNSPNVVSAAQYALEKINPSSIITFSGFTDNNQLKSMNGYGMWVPFKDYGMVESAHSYFLHILIDLVCKKREGRPFKQS